MGVATIALILLLERTRLGSLGLVVAVVGDLRRRPRPGLVRGRDAQRSRRGAQFPAASSDAAARSRPGPSRARAVAGVRRTRAGRGHLGQLTRTPTAPIPTRRAISSVRAPPTWRRGCSRDMPVGGSLSATALNKAAGARSRQSLRDRRAGDGGRDRRVRRGRRLRGHARPGRIAHADRLPHRQAGDLRSVWRVGAIQRVVLVVTFVLTMLIPLQYAVLVGVGLSVILHVVRQSNQITIKRWELDAEGHLIETDPPDDLPANAVVVLQPYGSLFFAAAATFEATPAGRDRGVAQLGGDPEVASAAPTSASRSWTCFAGTPRRSQRLDSKLVIVSANERILEQLGGHRHHRRDRSGEHLRPRRPGGLHGQAGLSRRTGLGRAASAERRVRCTTPIRGLGRACASPS